MLSGLIPGIVLYASAIMVLMGIGLTRSMWRLRKCFAIAARSPVLLCLGGRAHVALVFLQIMAQVLGDTFPCTITIWASYISFGTISTAYLLRTARLVVVYDKALRAKYVRQVRPAVQRRCMLVVLAGCCVAAVIVQLKFAARRQRAGVCYFFEDGYCVFLPITVLYLAAMVAMANRIRDTNDTFRIKNEMSLITASTAITTVLRTAHVAMLKHRSHIFDWNVPPTIHDLAACSAALYISFCRPLSAFYGISHGRLPGFRSAERVYVVEHKNADLAGDEGEAGGRGLGQGPASWGVLQMLRSDTMCALLVDFCERNLCRESVDFLVDVTLDYETLQDSEEQFETLSRIVETYLAQGSTHEINVSNSDRNKAAAWVKNKEAFLTLGKDERAQILSKQRDEIAKMLSENLLLKFKQTSLAQKATRALTDVAGGSSVTSGDQDADMRMMLQASAAVDVASINRTVARESNNQNNIVLMNIQMSIEEDEHMEQSYTDGSYDTFEDTVRLS